MIFRNLDANGDWVFGNGNGDFVQKDAAISLNIKTRLYSWLNDCFFDLNAGIDWLNRLGSKNQRTLLELDIRRIILSSEGVTGIVSFDTVLNSQREFTGSYNIKTIYSPSYQDSITLGVPQQ